ncbi:hypothetical protein COI63_23965 [Bacillus toyonensis]|uniref:hypothetical protein n=1 Tax=Bacillus toyonensis TaxID=155322 RepID=UPI000BFB959E|nr:hypothetical protein [Bacillus toyonensis]PHG02663.1 hypothetical protein COI63_23965 [Bacillus toyonensis]
MGWMYKNAGDKNPIWTSDQYETKEKAIEAAWEKYFDESINYTRCFVEYQIGQFNHETESIENIEKIDVSLLY